MTSMTRLLLHVAAGGLAVGLAAGLLPGATGAARAQSQDDRFSSAPRSGLFTGSIGSLFGRSAPTAPAGKDDWSGESGASGHPLMQADAIRAAAANFPNCLAGYWPDAARRGVSRATFERATAGLTPDLKIMDFVDAQPEFTKALWDYLDLLVSDARIKRGREILAANKATFDAVERAYGVDRHIVVAIWGIESNFSTAIGDRSVLRSTATLACVGRRQGYFKDEFLATLEILDRGDLTSDELKGSWAGAFGPTQFMPTAFKRYAVDFDGDGRRDVVASIPDLIASTANNLKLDGWKPGESWGYEVTLPQGFDYLLADGKPMTLHDWESHGVRRAGGKLFPRGTDKAFLLLPAGARGPAFLILNNLKVIMRYNPAEAYALAIGHLADRLRGDPEFVQPWPRDERVLTAAERYELQQLLVAHGFDIGSEPNGRIDARTRRALTRYQVAAGLVPDGFATAGLLDRLRAGGVARR
ncbi:MAG TPA: lytic murein transglycosylase [Xanthobacteraceae bacterium]|nr:lytic murein transglycosylase [Xanthobacteraceae bacterium]